MFIKLNERSFTNTVYEKTWEEVEKVETVMRAVWKLLVLLELHAHLRSFSDVNTDNKHERIHKKKHQCGIGKVERA